MNGNIKGKPTPKDRGTADLILDLIADKEEDEAAAAIIRIPLPRRAKVFMVKNDELSMKNHEFCIQNDELCHEK